MPAFKNEKRVFNFWLQWNVSLNLQMSTMISMFRHIERADWPSSASSIFRVFCSSSIVCALFKHCSNIYLGIVQVLLNYCSGFFKYFSIIAQVHMGPEHASREKKLTMVNFLIFVQKNVSTIRFQEIKIRPLKGFEKMRFLCFYIIGV